MNSMAAMLRTSEVIGWALRTLAEDAGQAGLGQQDQADPRILDLVRALDAPPEKQPTRLPNAMAAHSMNSLGAIRTGLFAAERSRDG